MPKPYIFCKTIGENDAEQQDRLRSFHRTERKSDRILSEIARVISFLIALYGSYKLPDTVFEYMGWNSTVLEAIIALFLACVSTAFIILSRRRSEFAALKYAAASSEFALNELSESAEEAVLSSTTFPLHKHCSPTFWESLK